MTVILTQPRSQLGHEERGGFQLRGWTGTLHGWNVTNELQLHDSRGVLTPPESPMGSDSRTRRNIETCLPLLKVRKTEVGNAKDSLESDEEQLGNQDSSSKREH